MTRMGRQAIPILIAFYIGTAQVGKRTRFTVNLIRFTYFRKGFELLSKTGAN